MDKLGNLLIIVGVVFAVLKALLDGHIKTVEGGGLILIAIVFLIAVRRSKIAKVIAVAIPIYFFAKEYGFASPVDFISLVITLFPLFIVLFGLYIILRAPFKK
jgi:hypothetical protein